MQMDPALIQEKAHSDHIRREIVKILSDYQICSVFFYVINIRLLREPFNFHLIYRNSLLPDRLSEKPLTRANGRFISKLVRVIDGLLYSFSIDIQSSIN